MEPIKIVIADDHTLFREGLAMLINSTLQFRVTQHAKDGEQLLELLDRLKDSADFPNICLLDINMPVLNGYDTMKVLAERHRQLPVLALTMYEADFSVLSMISLGASGFLPKNFHKDKLLEALESLATGDFYFPEEIARGLIAHNKAVPGLSDREIEFLGYCHCDLSYKAIADKMFVSERTVHSYRDSLFLKLNCRTRNALVAYAFRTGIITG